MKITKRNGNITVYDDEKLIRSILKANSEVPQEALSETIAARLADDVMAELTAVSEIITTGEIRTALCALLRKKGYPLTAEHYMNYQK